MKRRPYCVQGMSARQEKQCIDSGNVWDLTGASALSTCGHWQCWPRGRGRANKPLATCARQQGWQKSSGRQPSSRIPSESAEDSSKKQSTQHITCGQLLGQKQLYRGCILHTPC